MLIGQMLSTTGLSFMSASGRHTKDGLRDVQVTVKSSTDGEAVSAWAASKGLTVTVRIATPDEVANWEQWQE